MTYTHKIGGIKHMTSISSKTISIKAIKKKVGQAVDDVGGFRMAADKWSTIEWGMTASYLRGVVNGPELPSKKLCMVIGFEPIKEIKYRYREIK